MGCIPRLLMLFVSPFVALSIVWFKIVKKNKFLLKMWIFFGRLFHADIVLLVIYCNLYIFFKIHLPPYHIVHFFSSRKFDFILVILRHLS